MEINNLKDCDIPTSKAQIEGLNYLDLQEEYWKLLKRFNLLSVDYKKLKSKVIEVDGWKGIGSTQVTKERSNWILKEYHKEKKSGEIKEKCTVVPELNVANLWLVIQNKCVPGRYYTCHDIADFLGYEEWKDLWKERAKYFKEYYFPLKILEGLGFVDYESKTKIRRLK